MGRERGRILVVACVAAVLAAPACGDGGGLNGGDTFTDSASGLTWPTGNPGPLSWADAQAYCAGLTLGGHRDWRLPTIAELRTLVRGCPTQEPAGGCGVADACLADTCQQTCFPCPSAQGPTDGCYGPPELADPCGSYWSANLMAGANDAWWDLDFEDGFIDTNDYDLNGVLCVRP
jgi:hypothetical protein